MKYKISTKELSEPVLENHLPEGYHDPLNPFSERDIVIENAMGKGMVHECFFENMHIMYEEMNLARNILIKGESDYEVVELHFELTGHSIRNINGFEYTSFVANSHNIVYTPAGKVHCQFSRLSRALQIHIPVPRFRRYVENMGVVLLDKFLKCISNQEPTQLSRHNLPVTYSMIQVVTAMLHCSKQGLYKRVFLEAKAIELFLMQLQHFQSSHSYLMRPEAVEKMYYAKDIVLENLHNPLSLPELAQKVGTNEFALKKGFKEIFGYTVFGLIAEVKMDKAKEILISRQMNISELSYHLGYSNVANFSSAFKKRFGVSPLKFVKDNI